MEPLADSSFTLDDAESQIFQQPRAPPPSYCDVGWASYLTFGWVNPIVVIGMERQPCLEDTPDLAHAEDSLVNTQKFVSRLEYNERDGRKHPLLRAYMWSFRFELLIMFMFLLVEHSLSLAYTPLFEQILVFQEGGGSNGNSTSDGGGGGGPFESLMRSAVSVSVPVSEQEQDGEETWAKQNPVTVGFLAVFGLILVNLVGTFLSFQKGLYEERLKTRLRSAMQGAVMLRAIQNRNTNRTDATQPITPYNVLSFDIEPNVQIIFTILSVWLFPYQISTTLALLGNRIGGAAVLGLIVIFFAKATDSICYTVDGLLRDRLLTAKDKRLALCSEAFLNIRGLQMLSWIDPYRGRIMEARSTELRFQRNRLWLTKMASALDTNLPQFVTFVVLAYFVLVDGNELKASVALPVINLLTTLADPWGGPFTKIPQWINEYLIWTSAYKRVNTFMGVNPFPKTFLAQPEMVAESRALAVHEHLEMVARTRADGGEMRSPVPGMAAQLEQCTLTWGENEHGQPLGLLLQNLNLSIKSGDLVLMVGKSGTGKSSVLHALLGEMQIRSGFVHSPAAQWLNAERLEGSKWLNLPATTKMARVVLAQEAEINLAAVAYAGQTATLFTGTVMSNIIFGAPFMPDVYASVLKGCALLTDLEMMPAGDKTQIAHGGITLSGGQRSRLCLARAVYRAVVTKRENPSFVPLVLLDDPFSALDRRVTLEICEAIFTQPHGLLSGCGVAVATTDPWWLKSIRNDGGTSKVPHVAILQCGQVAACGTLDQLADKGIPELATALAFQETPNQKPNQAPNTQVQAGKADQSTAKTEKAKDKPNGDKENRESGRVKLRTYKEYVSAAGPGVFVMMFMVGIGVGVFSSQIKLTIGYWTVPTEKRLDENIFWWFDMVLGNLANDTEMLVWYLGLCVLLFSLCNVTNKGLQIIGGVRATQKMFADALEGTLLMPFRWWDTNPTGRVLNRFSEDVEVLDQAITEVFGIIWGAVVQFIEGMFIIYLSNPFVLLLVPFMCVAMEFWARFYRNTIQELHRVWLVSMGKVYQEVCELLDGKIVMRAYALQGQGLCRCMDNIDRFQQITFAKWCVTAWFGLRMRLIGWIIFTFTALAPIFQYYGLVARTSAGTIGFAIQSSTQIVNTMNQFINDFSRVEMELISVERLLEYSDARHMPKEYDELAAPLLFEQMTKQAGQFGLELKDVEVAYFPGAKPALADVSLQFSPGETVAVVGRTGAGKSSLLLSVLQLVPYKGTISVGGQALAALPPAEVRAKIISVVPQHPTIFAGDVAWNLDPETTKSDAELQLVLEAVGLWPVIAAAGGLEAMLTGSHDDTAIVTDLSLSQSQQQLFSTARVLLRQPRVVLLDEITSSLHSDVARVTLQILLKVFKEMNTTVLMVTHQEKLVPLFDREIIAQAGRIISDRRLDKAAVS